MAKLGHNLLDRFLYCYLLHSEHCISNQFLSFLATDSSQHTQGPLDGSLYATILKSPKSPDDRSSIISETPSKLKLRPTIVVPNLISPPPEFSNTKLIDNYNQQQQQQRFSNVSNYSNTASINHKELLQRSQSYTPSQNYEEIRIPSTNTRHSSISRDIIPSRTTTIPRPSSSQSLYHDRNYNQQQQTQPPRSLSRISNYTPNVGSYPPSSHQIRPIESYHYSPASTTTTTTVGTNNVRTSNQYVVGRDSSVRSPLTLSMDSGISSSGVTNRKFAQ